MPKFKIDVEGYDTYVTVGKSAASVRIGVVLAMRDCGALKKNKWPKMKVTKA